MPKKDTVFSCCIIDIPYIPKYSVSFYDNFYAKNKGSHYTELIFLKKLKKKKSCIFGDQLHYTQLKDFLQKNSRVALYMKSACTELYTVIIIFAPVHILICIYVHFL